MTTPDEKKDRHDLQAMKNAGQQIVMLTCYDFPTAVAEERAGVDVIFVGDSVGTNILGYDSETEVTMDDMVHHLRAVGRGVQNAYLLVDLPYGSFATPEIALENAGTLLTNGADGVKLEGGLEQEPVVRALTQAGIDVCAHIGFTPQTLGSRGKVQGRSSEQAKLLIQSAQALARAGAFMVVLELVTVEVTRIITDLLHIPTIGIGSGPDCSGQVLVVADVLGISPFTRKIAQRYQELADLTFAAVQEYADDVRHRRFPSEANAFATSPEELHQLEQWLVKQSIRPV
jgi:3-methyl-2-oxobutanoate hydroxymethyltransferase